MANAYDIRPAELNKIKAQLKKIHEETNRAGNDVVKDIQLLQSLGCKSPALDTFFEFFATVEKDVLEPSLVYSSWLYKTLEHIVRESDIADQLE